MSEAARTPADVKDRMAELIEAADGLTGVTFDRDMPPERAVDACWFGTDVVAEREFISLGIQPPPMDVLAVVPIIVESIRPGLGDAERRAYEILDAVEDALRAGTTKLNESVMWSRIGNTSGAAANVDSKFAYRLTANLTAKYRI